MLTETEARNLTDDELIRYVDRSHVEVDELIKRFYGTPATENDLCECETEIAFLEDRIEGLNTKIQELEVKVRGCVCLRLNLNKEYQP